MARLFYGWVVVACAFVVLFLTYGVQYSFGVFVPAMVDDLGWTRASLGGAFSLYSVVYTAFTSVSGRLTDKFGPQRVIAVGGGLLGVGLIATASMKSPTELFVWYGIVAALGMSTAYIPCNMTLVRWFNRRRGLALGLASSGASFGILSVPLIALFLIEQYGWRDALMVLAAVLLLVTNIAARFMHSRPAELGLEPDGARLHSSTVADVGADLDENHRGLALTPQQALRTLSFWILLAAFALTMITVGVPFVHLASHTRDLGLPALTGAAAISLVGLFAALSNLALGSVSDRIGRRAALLIAYTAQCLAFGLFIRASDPMSVYYGAAAFGIFYGGFASLYPALIGDLFGAAHGGTIGGYVIAGGGLLGAWGPALVGYLRDGDGDFQRAFVLCLSSSVLAVVLVCLLPRAQAAPRTE